MVRSGATVGKNDAAAMDAGAEAGHALYVQVSYERRNRMGGNAAMDEIASIGRRVRSIKHSFSLFDPCLFHPSSRHKTQELTSIHCVFHSLSPLPCESSWSHGVRGQIRTARLVCLPLLPSKSLTSLLIPLPSLLITSASQENPAVRGEVVRTRKRERSRPFPMTSAGRPSATGRIRIPVRIP